MQIKSFVVAALAVTTAATSINREHTAIRRNVTAAVVQDATQDLAGAAFLSPDDVIRGLEKLTDIADSMIDIAGDFVNLNVVKVVPDLIVSYKHSLSHAPVYLAYINNALETCQSFRRRSHNYRELLWHWRWWLRQWRSHRRYPWRSRRLVRWR